MISIREKKRKKILGKFFPQTLVLFNTYTLLLLFFLLSWTILFLALLCTSLVFGIYTYHFRYLIIIVSTPTTVIAIVYESTLRDCQSFVITCYIEIKFLLVPYTMLIADCNIWLIIRIHRLLENQKLM